MKVKVLIWCKEQCFSFDYSDIIVSPENSKTNSCLQRQTEKHKYNWQVCHFDTQACLVFLQNVCIYDCNQSVAVKYRPPLNSTLLLVTLVISNYFLQSSFRGFQFVRKP